MQGIPWRGVFCVASWLILYWRNTTLHDSNECWSRDAVGQVWGKVGVVWGAFGSDECSNMCGILKHRGRTSSNDT